jgi:hypothetical protein
MTKQVTIFLVQLVGLGAAARPAIADATYQPVPLWQDWSDTGQIAANDDWSGVPGILGFRGDGLTSATGVDPQTVTGDDVPGVIDVNANQIDPLGAVAAGVTEFELSDPSVAVAGSGTADAPYLVVHIDATGKSDLVFLCRLRDLEAGGVDDAVSQVALQFRTAASGAWTNLPSAYVSDASWAPFLAGGDTPLHAALPPAADNAATLQIRVITTNAVGNDEWIGVDDILVMESAAFLDVTSGPLGDPMPTFGVSWGDYDDDNDPDLFMSDYSDVLGDKLLRNEGGGTFTDVTTPPVAGPGESDTGAAWADHDNDGDLDLCVGVVGVAGNRLLRNDGAGAFTESATPGSSSYGVAWGDYDNDGAVDLYVTNYGSANQLLRNDGGGAFSDVTSGPLGNADNGLGTAWGDYDDDGDLDIYLVNEGAPNKLLRNDGAGAFVDDTSGSLGGTGNGSGFAWGDYDNDGDLDLYLTNSQSGGGQSKLFRNDGSGSFADVTTPTLGVGGGGFGSVAWVDHDLDGDLDLSVTVAEQNNPISRWWPSLLFRNDGIGGFVRLGGTATAAEGAVGQTWADHDGDGDLDLYVANLGGSNTLFRNEQATANHWLQVELVGNPSNRSGIGARVRVVAGGLAQVREISGSACMGAQNSLLAEFGLGTATVIDSLVIRWPSGTVQVVGPPPAVDQRTTIPESASPSGAPVVRPTPFSLAVFPNPAASHALVRYALPRESLVSLDLFDVSGRRVAVLAAGLRGEGAHEVRLARGGLAAGLYFCRLTAGSITATEKVVLGP